MSPTYDNWERLVDAVLKRDLYRQLALAPSFDSSISEDFSSRCSFDSSVSDFDGLFRSGVWIGDIGKQILAKPIQLADQVIKAADASSSFKHECLELKSKSEKLAGLLHQAARASNNLYERPTSWIIVDTEQVLNKALSLALKCRGNGVVKRMFTIIPTAAFRKISSQLENSIGNISWLLRVSAPSGDRGYEYLGLPTIAANEPIRCLMWELIPNLFTGLGDDRGAAAASLVVSLVRDNDRYGKLIIEEGGVGPLLRLLKEGKTEGQEHAAKAIGLLGKDPESVEHMIVAGVCSVFAEILKEGPMRVQAVVAWATSELVAHHRNCQDLFAQHNIIQLLVNHLAFGTMQEHSKYAIVSKATSMHAAVVLASNNSNTNNTNSNNTAGVSVTRENDETGVISHPLGNNNNSNNNNEQPSEMLSVVTSTMALKAVNGAVQTNNLAQGNNNENKSNSVHNSQSISSSGSSNRAREMEDPDTKAYVKEMAARALWQLSKGNLPICRSITEFGALLCFAVLLEKGPEKVQYNSALALMEISAVAEEDAELRRSVFKPNSPACKAVVDQLFRVIEKADSELLVPCVKAIGNLARTFRAMDTRMISPLVKLLDEQELEVSNEACVALTKFACSDNYLHLNHSKAIVDARGVKHLIQLVYFGEQLLQNSALILLSYIALHLPESEELARTEVLTVLQWASKKPSLAQDEDVKKLKLQWASQYSWSQYEDVEKFLTKAVLKLERYQSRDQGDSVKGKDLSNLE